MEIYFRKKKSFALLKAVKLNEFKNSLIVFCLKQIENEIMICLYYES